MIRGSMESMSPAMRILSADLAYRDYRDIGIALLEPEADKVKVTFKQLRGVGEPKADITAQKLAALAAELEVDILFLDGPQGWKDPDSMYPHSRVCERVLNTPAKTGLPGQVKPANYAPFVAFSIEVFDSLQVLGWPRYGGPLSWPQHTAVESFPLSAWRSLGLPILPAKAKATEQDLCNRLASLKAIFNLDVSEDPNHDELQAIVSGLAGIALLRGDMESFRIEGTAPFALEGTVREGFIVNPVRRP